MSSHTFIRLRIAHDLQDTEGLLVDAPDEGEYAIWSQRHGGRSGGREGVGNTPPDEVVELRLDPCAASRLSLGKVTVRAPMSLQSRASMAFVA